jgi:uncharacterized phiE125 gp8 family phage protein
MRLDTITPPAVQPVTLADCYSHLRLDPEGSPATHTDDTMLTRHIASATRFAEIMTRRAFVSQGLRLYLPKFDTAGMNLYRPPLISVDSVQYYDIDNALQSVDTADWYVTDDLVPQLRFVSGFSAPAIYDRPDAVRINYTVGYAPEGSPADYTANIPSVTKDAILLGVELLYESLSTEHRAALERTRTALLTPYKVFLTP